ncbi:odorant receptor 63a-like [Diabrotica virgifera virgifera]|nr:odorant receptor 63a-like [Diabrotica virgifera virgifera]
MVYNRNDKRTVNIWYYIWSWISCAICFCYLLSSWTGVYDNIVHDFDVQTCSQSIMSCCRQTIYIARIFYLWKEDTINLLRGIKKREEQIYDSQDKDIIDIMNTNIKNNRKLDWWYILFQMGVVFFYMTLAPYLFPTENVILQDTNTTVSQRSLPVKYWFPFDEEKHFNIAFGWEIFSLMLAGQTSFALDLFFFSSLAFILGQVKILRFMLDNFEKYRAKAEAQEKCTRSTADLLTLKLFICEHQRLLRFINDFNSCMRTLVLLDFFQTSLQIGVLIMYDLYELKRDNLLLPALGLFYLILTGGNVAIYYWYGDEITSESYDLADAIYDIKWYNKSKEFKKMLSILLTRCHTVVGIEIGGITIMSRNICIGLFKGAYTFVQFALQM